MSTKKCPICVKSYIHPALSRRDNKTKICPDCGIAEAFEDLINFIAYRGKK